VLRLVAVTWAVTLAVFLMMNVLPGNAAAVQLGTSGTPAEEAALAGRLGLLEPLPERYLRWLAGLPLGRLGRSLSTGQPVAGVLRGRLPVSLELVVLAMAVAVGLAVPAALLSASRPHGLVDRLTMALGTTAVSTAPFVLGLGLVLLFAVRLSWFPAIGFVPLDDGIAGNLRSLVLPVATLALPLAGGFTRLLRSDLIDQLQQDYVATARAGGASRWRVLSRHALRNSLFGSVTMAGLSLGTLLGGTVVVEQVFALPGLGSELLQAVQTRDTNMVEAIVLLLAGCVVLANVLTDQSYRMLDRRVDLGQ
jgi:peptide/nickel transport system permease protein